MSARATLGLGAAFLGARWRWHTLDAARLAAFQEARARAQVRWVAAHAPAYRAHWRGYDLDNWRSLPTVDKATILADFQGFNTRGIRATDAQRVAQRAEQEPGFAPRLGALTVGLSSGTSGQRGLFLVSPAEQRAWAGTILARALHRLTPARIAFFLRANSPLYEQVGSRVVQFRYFDLRTSLAETVPALNSYAPTVLVGPPSLLAVLAEVQGSGALRITPERLISVAEVLEPQDEAVLEAAFGVRVEQIYQATEGLLAVTCPHGGLHIQEDVVVVETEPLAEGRVTPILTDLWRRTQPIVRYRLGDVLTLGDTPCTCGSPFRTIARIEGRCADLLTFDTPHGPRLIFPDAIRRAVLGATGAVRDFRAVQRAPSALDVTLDPHPGADPATLPPTVEAALRATLAAHGCPSPHLTVRMGIEPEAPGVKRRRVQTAVQSQQSNIQSQRHET